MFQIARRVAKDRVISTVDPQARHGRKTVAHAFDGYKGHVGIDPDSELVTATAVSAGNAGDAGLAEDLIGDLLADTAGTDTGAAEACGDDTGGDPAAKRGAGRLPPMPVMVRRSMPDNAYGTGAIHDRLGRAGIQDRCKSQAPVAVGDLFAKDRFEVDLGADTVTCPAGQVAPIRRGKHGAGTARFGGACAGCPLREQCTKAAAGRSVTVGVYEQQLVDARARQRDPGWVADYRATRPKVERKFGYLMRRRHGGRRARVRGLAKVGADFALLAAG